MSNLLKLAAIAAIITAVFVFSYNVVNADPPPGNDGECTHGQSDQPCRPDPQPDNGKDCEEHGNNPDGNEDHCGPIETPTEEPSPTVTPDPSSTPTPDPTISPTPPVNPTTTPAPTTTPVTPTTPPDDAVTPQAPEQPSQPVTPQLAVAPPLTGDGGLLDMRNDNGDLKGTTVLLIGFGVFAGLALMTQAFRLRMP